MPSLFKSLILALLALVAAPAAAKPFQSDRIVVTSEGRGPDVVLIHGLGSNARIWKGTTAALPGYRYHYVQVRGFGGEPNRGNTGDPAIAPIVEDISRYISEERLKPVAVVGHSLGGTMGMMLAARHPQQVRKLMVVDMMPFVGAMFGGADVDAVRPMVEGMFAQMAKTPPAQRDAFLVQTINGMVRTEGLRAGVLAESRASDQPFVQRTYKEVMLTDLRPELAKITAPTTVLYVLPQGGPIQLTAEQIDGFYAQQYATLKNVRLVRVPDAAHFIMFDQPARFQAELKSFLAK